MGKWKQFTDGKNKNSIDYVFVIQEMIQKIKIRGHQPKMILISSDVFHNFSDKGYPSELYGIPVSLEHTLDEESIFILDDRNWSQVLSDLDDRL